MTAFGALMIVVAAMLGFGLMALLRKLQRHLLTGLARVIGAVLPVLAWIGFGLLDRCIPIPAGERCYYFGMGLVVFAPFFAAWLLGSLGGAVIFRRGK